MGPGGSRFGGGMKGSVWGMLTLRRSLDIQVEMGRRQLDL